MQGMKGEEGMSLSDEKAVNIVAVEEVGMSSIVTGNKQIEIIGHKPIIRDGIVKGVSINYRNAADVDIGKAMFEAIFYDIQRNIIDKFVTIVRDVEKNTARILNIEQANDLEGDISSYDVTVINVVITPAPVVKGNGKIQIMGHTSKPAGTEPRVGFATTLEISLRNVTDKTVATAVFNVAYLDSEGNVLDSFKHREKELKAKCSRAVIITTEKVRYEFVKSYRVILEKTIMVDTEKVQLQRYEMRSIDNGDIEVRTIIKNISGENVNAVLSVTFKDASNEKIATKMVLVNNLNPGMIRKVNFKFDVPDDEIVKICIFEIGDIIQYN
jgi:hypothetical protein